MRTVRLQQHGGCTAQIQTLEDHVANSCGICSGRTTPSCLGQNKYMCSAHAHAMHAFLCDRKLAPTTNRNVLSHLSWGSSCFLFFGGLPLFFLSGNVASLGSPLEEKQQQQQQHNREFWVTTFYKQSLTMTAIITCQRSSKHETRTCNP